MVILPQCVKRMTPPWMNLYAILTVATPLTSVVGVSEAMTFTGDILSSEGRTELLIPMYLYLLTAASSSTATRSRVRRSRSKSVSRCDDEDVAMTWTPDQPLVSLKDVRKSFARAHGAQRRLAGRHEGRGDLHHRPIRLRQVDAAPLHQRAGADRLGSILVEGQEVNDPKLDKLALRRKVGMVFQQYNLFPHKTALENVMMAPVHVLEARQARGGGAGARADREGAARRQGGDLSGRALRRAAAAHRDRALRSPCSRT